MVGNIMMHPTAGVVVMTVCWRASALAGHGNMAHSLSLEYGHNIIILIRMGGGTKALATFHVSSHTGLQRTKDYVNG